MQGRRTEGGASLWRVRDEVFNGCSRPASTRDPCYVRAILGDSKPRIQPRLPQPARPILERAPLSPRGNGERLCVFGA